MRPVGIAVTVFPVPADFERGLDAMIQPVAEVLYVNQAMGDPLYRPNYGLTRFPLISSFPAAANGRGQGRQSRARSICAVEMPK